MTAISIKSTALCLILFTAICFGQAKKPTIMVVPSDVWMNQNGYMTSYDDMGTSKKVPDYKKAVQENTDLILVMTKIGELMAERGFPLKSLESALKTLESESAEDAMATSKGGASIAESPVDKLKKTAKADIIMEATWTVNQIGPKKSITFILAGKDAYSDKQIAAASGTGTELIGATMPVMLETSVLSYLDGFNAQLMTHFDDMVANGREIVVRIKRWDSWENDLETEYDGEELGSVIEGWLSKNSVNGRFSTSDATENMMLFEQVRIPLADANGKAMDARSFGKQIQNFLKAAPYTIIAKVSTKGLGQVVISLGEK